MDSFKQSGGFRYNLNSNTLGDEDGDSECSGLLEIYVHHARNIHNICVYDNQDVYAKFSLTYNPDEALSTRIINGGGKNPEFNESLMMKVTQLNAVLKCEIWMLSGARNLMEDQLLGFALVPISQVVGKGKIIQDYGLSSTDLFHSPAGTVRLSLSLNTALPVHHSTATNTSISSEVVLLDRKITETLSAPVEYAGIEFPDMNVVRENRQMVSEYFDCMGSRPGSFLHLGSSPRPVVDDYEMTVNSPDENQEGPASVSGSIKNSGFFSSTTTSLSETDRTTSDSVDLKNRSGNQSSNSFDLSVITEANLCSRACPDTPTSKKGNEVIEQKDSDISSKEKDGKHKKGNMDSVKFGPVFSAPLGNMNLEAEQSAMQRQIVDMYMRSMQQFTESLAKMKLPMDLNKPEVEVQEEVIQRHCNEVELDKKKKDGSRVFYGSRAFF